MSLISIAFVYLSLVSVHAGVAPELRSALIGACFDLKNDQLLYCAAIEEECDLKSGMKFRNANELEILGDYECNTETLPIGTCRSTGQCALTDDSCDNIVDFSSEDINKVGCNAEGIISNKRFVPTQYGACLHGTTDEVTCVLTPDDCTEKEAWISANVAKLKRYGGCKCHDVKVGACVRGPSINPMLSQCAISKDDCNPLIESYSSARDVMDHALLDCRLCAYDEYLTTSNEKNEPTSAGDDMGPTGLSQGKSAFSTGENIAFAVVGIISVLTISLVVAYPSIKKWKQKNKNSSEKDADVTLDAEIS